MNYILTINAGSSSLKFKLFDERFKEVAVGNFEKIGQPGSFVSGKIKGKEFKSEGTFSDHIKAFEHLAEILRSRKINFNQIKKVGHRVVHGAEKFTKPTLVTNKILEKLSEYNKLAPLHNPNNIAGIKAGMKLLPKAKHFALFDTAFHQTIPDFAFLYPLPYSIYEKYQVRRYGFHGLSHQYVSIQAGRILKKKKPNLITCHLGSGCSITAIKQGASVDTSMGFTPLEGLMMSSRSGDIDPAIIFYLEREGMSMTEVDELLNSKSGLKGVSGMKDMRDIMIASGYKVPGYTPSVSPPCKGGDKRERGQRRYLASLALNMFVYRVRKYIGAYAAVLGHVDAVVFTAGIGERNADIRKLIMRGLALKTRALVIPTNEELMMAKLIS